MNVKQLLQDEDAVSPVIGVILMVAITVILAAVIGTFVLGLGDQVQSSAPNANFQFEYSEGATAGYGETGDTENEFVNITHNGGQDVELSNVEVQIGSGTVPSADLGDGTNTTIATAWPDTISTGDTVEIQDTNSFITSGATVRVIWQSDSGGSSNTIGESTVPS